MNFVPNPARLENTHRASQEQGPPVIGGKLLWTSATGITTADPQSSGGCTRKWFYDTVEHRKGPPTKAMLAGTGLHTEIENRLLKGATLQSPLALAGGHFIPHAGSGLHVEKPIHFATRDGIQIYGHVDLYNLRQEYIDSDGQLQRDPPWSFEVKDWKTTSNFDYAKTERELAENIQLVTYAEAGFRMWPDLEHARLTHVYFRTRGAPASKLVTIRRTREEIGSRWEYAEGVIRVMRDASGETSADRVPANTRSCGAYSGCIHASYCTAYQHSSLDSLYNKVASDWRNNSPPLSVQATQHSNERTPPVGLITQQPQFTQQQLAQEEVQMRQQVAQTQMNMPQNPAELLTVCTRLGSYGFGMPSLAGNAAQAYAAAGGQSVAPGFVYQGLMAPPGAQYSLHAMTLTEVAQVYQIEREAAAKVAPAPAPMFPPVQMPQPTPPVQMVQQETSFLPPGAPESRPELAQARAELTLTPDLPPAPYVLGSEPAAAPAAPPVKRGRPKKSQDAAPEGVAAVTAPAPPSSPPSAPAPLAPPVLASPTPSPESGGGLSIGVAKAAEDVGTILINARFANKATKSLAGYVDYVNAELAKRYCVTADGKPCVQDVRCAPKDSVLAFGAWKGAVREVVKADPPPPNDYHLDLNRDELNEVVADALRVVAEQRGWTYVRGVLL